VATWRELSAEALAAARALLDRGYFRSCVTRAYYAVYAAATSELTAMKGVAFPFGWGNPSHQQLPGLIRSRLTQHSERNRRELVKAIRRLRMAREDADYRPGASVDRTLALNVVRDACVSN
jgi:uncharacterized protein (UPF0332 family)